MTVEQVFESIDTKWRMEQWPSEIRPFASYLCTAWPTIKSKVVLELGVRHGGTSALWHALLPDARVIGVDRVGHDSLQEPEFSARARQMEAALPRFRFINGDTEDPHTLSRVVELIDGQHIGFLFIDADHTYEAVRRDFYRFGALVEWGGIIALHDIVDTRGVDKFWEEISKTHANVVFNCGGAWGGIGAVVR